MIKIIAGIVIGIGASAVVFAVIIYRTFRDTWR